MEFSDCLIYNFFSSSGLGSISRIIGGAYDYLGAEKDGKPFTKFDYPLHKKFNKELKYLYVLLTRAKKNLIIFDENIEARKPFLNLWSNKNINAVEKKMFDEDIKNILSVISSPQDWCKKGKEFFDKKNYEEAKKSYYRGGDNYNEKISHAKWLSVQATTIFNSQNSDKNPNVLYEQAGDIYLSINLEHNAAEEYLNGCNYKTAAEIFKSVGNSLQAAICYELDSNYKEAALCYFSLDKMKEMVDTCSKGKLFHFALDLIDGKINSLKNNNENKNETDKSDKSEMKENVVKNEKNENERRNEKNKKNDEIVVVKENWDENEKISENTNENEMIAEYEMVNDINPTTATTGSDVLSVVRVPGDSEDGVRAYGTSNNTTNNTRNTDNRHTTADNQHTTHTTIPTIIPPSILILRDKLLTTAGEYYTLRNELTEMMKFVSELDGFKAKSFLKVHSHSELLVEIELKGMYHHV